MPFDRAVPEIREAKKSSAILQSELMLGFHSVNEHLDVVGVTIAHNTVTKRSVAKIKGIVRNLKDSGFLSLNMCLRSVVCYVYAFKPMPRGLEACETAKKFAKSCATVKRRGPKESRVVGFFCSKKRKKTIKDIVLMVVWSKDFLWREPGPRNKFFEELCGRMAAAVNGTKSVE